jgi:hypothetical protein
MIIHYAKKITHLKIIALVICLSLSCDFNSENAKFNNINQEQITNLSVLCKVWGFIKYYDPTIGNEKVDWDIELIKMFQPILNAKTYKDRNNLIFDWIRSFKGFQSESLDDTPIILQYKNVRLYPEINWIYSQRVLGNELSNILIKISQLKREGNNQYVSIDLETGRPSFDNEKAYSDIIFPDKNKQLLALFRMWNVIAYFYPYRDIIEADWDNILIKYIPLFLEVDNASTYRKVIQKLVSHLTDGHADVVEDRYITMDKGDRIAPYEIAFIENKPIVTRLFPNLTLMTKNILKIGDIIKKINNKDVQKIIEDKEKLLSASNYSSKLWKIGIELLRTNKRSMLIQIERDSKIMEFEIDTFPLKEIGLFTRLQNKESLPFQDLGDNIGYFYMGSEIDFKLTDLDKFKGLILDFRCYPSTKMLEYFEDGKLINESIDFARWTCGSVKHPGLFYYKGVTSRTKIVKNYFKGKIAILVNELTISQSEFLTMYFKRRSDSFIVGSQTAGADGDVTKIALPDSTIVSFSGLGIYYPDFEGTQKKGIDIDYYVTPTISEIIEGKDSIKEKAISILKDLCNVN